MSDEHSLSSDDLLSRMKEQIHLRRENPHGSFITVTANEMTALVECAEVMHHIVIDMESGWLANHGKAAEKNYERLLAAAKAAMEKLK